MSQATPQRPPTSPTGRSVGKSTPALQNIPIPKIGTRRRRFTRDEIKQYVYMQAYGASPRKLRGASYAMTCIDEAHVIVTRDDYNSNDRDVYAIYGDLARQLGQKSWTAQPVRIGYSDLSAACGHCPRSLGCLKGMPPLIICPRCRRTNHGHGLARHAYRKEREDYDLMEDRGNMLAHKHDYVPTACPLWLKGAPMVAKKPCPICQHKQRVNAIYIETPQEGHGQRRVLHRRLRRRKAPTLTPSTFKDFLRSKLRHGKGDYATKHEQALRRPPLSFGARSVHKRQPHHHRR